MLEKNADGGIWFDEEPQDPLEKLVFASQRFLDEPLQLRPIEGEGVDPAFVGKPDICDPQAAERLASIGIKRSDSMPTYMDETIYFCSYDIYSGEELVGIMSINFPNFSIEDRISKDFKNNLFEINGGGAEYTCIGVFSTLDSQYLYSTYSNLNYARHASHPCDDISLTRQLLMNVQGGKHVNISPKRN